MVKIVTSDNTLGGKAKGKQALLHIAGEIQVGLKSFNPRNIIEQRYPNCKCIIALTSTMYPTPGKLGDYSIVYNSKKPYRPQFHREFIKHLILCPHNGILL